MATKSDELTAPPKPGAAVSPDAAILDSIQQAAIKNGFDFDAIMAEAPLEVSTDEISTCIRVLHSLQGRRRWLVDPELKPLRTAALGIVDVLNNRFYEGKSVEQYRKEMTRKRDRGMRKARAKKLKEQDQQLANQTEMRRQRLEALTRLSETQAILPPMANPLRLTAVSDDNPPSPASEGYTTVNRAKKCYICKMPYMQLHHFYSELCPGCAEVSFAKRNQTVDLTDRVALVTGGRIKIGYLTVLRLLRCGARVIVTTRFPHDSALRFAKEEDFSAWRDRLHVYGLDLRDIAGVERFCDHIRSTFNRLDMIINNAAQTVRRPPAFYQHLMQQESEPVPQDVARVLAQFDSHRQARTISTTMRPHPQVSFAEMSETAAEDLAGTAAATNDSMDSDSEAPESKHARFNAAVAEIEEQSRQDASMALVAGTGAAGLTAAPIAMAASAMLSQVPLVHGDDYRSETEFPSHHYDTFSQQLDLRKHNSWRMKLDEVSTAEMVECHAVNAVAPFIINARLKELMVATPGNKFIVNVSAMEGKFYRWKSPYHPHTNMAKASLNMMTRTSAQDYAESNIYMNAVDTGWVTDENPHERAQTTAERHNFQCPIDEADAMGRLLDPIFTGIRTGQCVYGKFLKDYLESEW
eukprot:TRINITY_DN14463_c0_g1_i1.p1 TRINITY_DN14463_c0_g1~~TRINITY_DN14463_c0_g1_i1.p1  ORF type:complete len:638 (-),score=159.87 TRINITY_DN14463_c0_g1_i1:14-1927(-)